MLSALMAAWFARAAAAEPPGEWRLDIAARQDNALVRLEPRLTAPLAGRVRYEVRAERTGMSSARSRQAGEADVAPGAPLSLGTLVYSIAPGERLHVCAFVYRQGRLVAQSAWQSGPDPAAPCAADEQMK